MQAPPSLPQLCFVSPAAQRFCIVQHPEQLKQRQNPPTQRSPAPHACWPPHVHAPEVLQPSARESQVWHNMPAGAQAVDERIVHAFIALQQPFMQVVAEHVEPTHIPASQLPAPQFEQLSPPVPQTAEVLPVTH
jgi:hypothetical protein